MKVKFVAKDMGRPRYFLELKITHNKNGAFLSQGKYTLNLLHETGLLGCKPVRIPMDTDADLWDETGSLFEDVSQYKGLVGKLSHSY